MKASSRPSALVKLTFACIVLAGLAACGGGSSSRPIDEDPEIIIEPRPGDHSDTLEGATDITADITAGRPIEGQIDSADDVDYFAFTLTETSEITLTVTGDVDVELLDSDGNVIAEIGSGFGAKFSQFIGTGRIVWTWEHVIARWPRRIFCWFGSTGFVGGGSCLWV